MASQERIDQLDGFAAEWRNLLSESKEKHARLLDFIRKLHPDLDRGPIDVLNKQIAHESDAATAYVMALDLVEATLANARAGHDV